MKKENQEGLTKKDLWKILLILIGATIYFYLNYQPASPENRDDAGRCTSMYGDTDC